MPMAIPVAMVAASAISAGASMASSSKQAGAIKSAQDSANAQAAADRAAVQAAGQEAQGIYTDAANRGNARVDPWRVTGQNALYSVADASGANGAEGMAKAGAAFQASPGYQWQLDQGLQAVDRQAAARGGLMNGRAVKAAETFGQGLASSEFDKYYNRLFALSAGGQAAAGTQAGIDMQSATDRSNALLGAATNSAQQGAVNSAMNANAATNQASIYGNGVNGAVGALNNGANNLLYAYGRGWLGGGSGAANADPQLSYGLSNPGPTINNGSVYYP